MENCKCEKMLGEEREEAGVDVVKDCDVVVSVSICSAA